MSNPPTLLEPGGGPASMIALRRLRADQAEGISRRALLRRSLGVGIGVIVTEWIGGSVGFLWSAAASAAPRVRVGTLADLVAANRALPIADGFPAYVPDARSFIVLVDPSDQHFHPGKDAAGAGLLNVRALSQRCPHLGCRPNPCVDDFWFHCPCHKSRYDRLGIKAAGTTYGPAARSMDRFAIEVDPDGVLTVDTGRITLGPLPIALGQVGIISPRVADGCS